MSQDGLRNTLEIISQRNPAVKVDMNISKYLDESTVDELEREGFFKRLLENELTTTESAFATA